MNHEMGLKHTLEISKQEILQHYHANFKLSSECPLEMNSKLVVSLTLPKKTES